MSDRDYLITETKARYSRDDILDMLLDYKKRSWDTATHEDLLEEIVNLHLDGCDSYNKYSTDELARCLVDERKWWGEME